MYKKNILKSNVARDKQYVREEIYWTSCRKRRVSWLHLLPTYEAESRELHKYKQYTRILKNCLVQIYTYNGVGGYPWTTRWTIMKTNLDGSYYKGQDIEVYLL
jgi:hypothetical protein